MFGLSGFQSNVVSKAALLIFVVGLSGCDGGSKSELDVIDDINAVDVRYLSDSWCFSDCTGPDCNADLSDCLSTRCDYNAAGVRGNVSTTRLTTSSGRTTGPNIAWSDDLQQFGVTFQTSEQVYFLRLDSAGSAVGQMLRIGPYADGGEAAIVWNGTEWAIAWADERKGFSQWDVFFARFDSNGVQIGVDHNISNVGNDLRMGAMVFDGIGYGLVWRTPPSNSQVVFARLDANGDRIGDPLVLGDGQDTGSYFSIAWSGSEYGVAWSDNRTGKTELYFARVSKQGTKITDEIQVTSGGGPADQTSLVWNGTEYGLAWGDGRFGDTEIFFRRLNQNGSLIGPETRVTCKQGNQNVPSLVWTGTDYGLAWSDASTGNDGLGFTKLTADGVVEFSPVLFDNESGLSWYPRMTFDGSNFAVVWEDDRDGNSEMYFALGNLGLPSP